MNNATAPPADAPASDWATTLALQIILDAHGYPSTSAIDLIAARLRLVHLEGIGEGMILASESVRDVFARAGEP